MTEKYRNKRLVVRRRGRYTRVGTLEQMGFALADGNRECIPCGHIWRPILTTGQCPSCGAQESREWHDD